MKTLHEFLRKEWDERVAGNVEATPDEHIAGLIGAVQAWLGQPELESWQPVDLIREAGRRPDDKVAE